MRNKLLALSEELVLAESRSLPTIPAVSTELAMIKPRAVKHIIQAMESKGRKMQLLADFFLHPSILWSVRVTVLLQSLCAYIVALKLLYDAASNQIHLAL